jgi:hypothetical protein
MTTLTQDFEETLSSKRGQFNSIAETMDNIFTLSIYNGGKIGCLQTHTKYDFLNRTVTYATCTGETVKPFRKCDREVLELMHNRLISLGGAPLPLPPHESPRGSRSLSTLSKSKHKTNSL